MKSHKKLPLRELVDILAEQDADPGTSDRSQQSSGGSWLQPVLFADPATVRRCVMGLRRAAQRKDSERQRYLATANRLVLSAGMKFSLARPVLTRLLAHRFWLPRRLHPNRWDEWALACPEIRRVTRSSPATDLLAALDHVATQEGSSQSPPEGLINALKSAELDAWACGGSLRPTGTHGAYRAVTTFESAWTEFCLSDLGLRDRHIVTGDVAVGRVVSVGRTTRIALGNVPRFNDSNLWIVEPGGRRRKVHKEALHVSDDDSLQMVFRVPARGEHFLAEAKSQQWSMTLYPCRFTMPSARPRRDNRWLNPPEKGWARRAVPPDVALAGG